MKSKFLMTVAMATAMNVMYAQDAPKPAPLNIGGTVDAYFRYASDSAGAKTAFNPTINGFALGMADLTLSKEVGKVGFFSSLSFGPRAEGIGYAIGSDGRSWASLRQLYIYYKPTDKLKFTLGTFNTHIGYELNEPTNMNYSLSYMFSYGPFFHTGLKAEYALTSELTAMVGVFDDTDSKTDVVKGKHIGAQLAYSKGKFKGYLNFLNGRETAVTTINQLDLVATYQATEKLGLGINVTNKQVKPKELDAVSWTGAALYATYATSDKFTLAFRGEYLGDKDGVLFGTTDQSITALTLSGNWKLGDLTLIPELRYDAGSKGEIFGTTFTPKANAATAILAAVYKF